MNTSKLIINKLSKPIYAEAMFSIFPSYSPNCLLVFSGMLRGVAWARAMMLGLKLSTEITR